MPLDPRIPVDESTRTILFPFPHCHDQDNARRPGSAAFLQVNYPYSHSNRCVRLLWIEQKKFDLKQPTVPSDWRLGSCTSHESFNAQYSRHIREEGLKSANAMATERWLERSIPFNAAKHTPWRGFSWWETVQGATSKEKADRRAGMLVTDMWNPSKWTSVYSDYNLLETYSDMQDFARLYGLIDEALSDADRVKNFPTMERHHYLLRSLPHPIRTSLAYLEKVARDHAPYEWEKVKPLFFIE